MSLIDEALRKARIEAAQKDAERQGLPHPAPAGLPGRPRRAGGGLAAGVVLGAALAAAAAGGLWLAIGRTERVVPGRAPVVESAQPGDLGEAEEVETAAAARPAGAIPAAPAGGTSAGSPRLESSPPTSPSATRTRPPPAPDPAAGAPAEPASGGASPATSARPTQPPASTELTPTPNGVDPPTEAAQAPTLSLAPAAEIPVFRRTATLPDGRTITLNGIAWREDAPAAILDGQVVSPGEGVGGVTVVAIERDRVVLEVESGRFVVRLP